MPNPTRRSPLPALRIALAATLLVSGCAGLPRIDPSGRRLLIWPDRQAATAPTFATAPSLGNVTVPPVYAGQAPPVAPPVVPSPNPVGGVGVPVTVPVANTAAKPADEKLSITPSRLLAPVGSEVILKAGVCSDSGYLRTNRRIEWMLGQEGAGQFVTVGEQGEMDIFRLPWQRPDKHDNAYAVGYTAPYNVCLRRGTEDASDDVQVERGEAWITVTSASEGVSYVTATAPESKDWDARRATATVYWVDAQWRLPESQTLQPGQTGTLTTTVTRQSDGAPVKGWLVRYEVVQGDTARLGYESGQTSQVETDAAGRASMQITPTDDQPGSAIVKVSVVRPATSAPMPAPQLELGGGEVAVAWTPMASPITPPVGDGFGTTPPADTPTPPSPYEPSPIGGGDTLGQPEPRVGPVLEVTFRRDGTGVIQADDTVPLTVTMSNTGDEPAENLSLEIAYDRGLTHPRDTQGRGSLPYTGFIPDLAPGESNVVTIDLLAVEPGNHCANVTVKADRGASAFERLCVDVQRPAPPPRPQLRIQTALDAVRSVGEKATYKATIYNDGPTAVEGLRVELYCQAQLDLLEATQGHVELAPGANGEHGIAWESERIEPRSSLSYQAYIDCLAPVASPGASVQIFAVFGGSVLETKIEGIEVRPAAPAEPPPVARPDLEGVLSSSANPAKVGQAATLTVRITNTTSRELRGVQYRLLFPTSLTPSPVGNVQVKDGALVFEPIERLAPGESHEAYVPYTPRDDGVHQVLLQMREGQSGTPVSTPINISVNSR